ncbi:MAG: chromate efflux transporter, partial [Gammaproteobacteria bacterium]
MPSLLQALPFWLKLGFISFGGPAGQIALLHTELVERRRWISEKRFLHALNYCMLLPGPEAIQLAIYISWLMHGMPGAVLAGVLFFLPAFVLLSLLAALYLHYGDVSVVAGIFYGIKPAVVAIVLFAAWRIGSKVLKNEWLYAIAVLAFVGIFVLDIGFPWIVLAAALIGWAGHAWVPQKFTPGAGHAASKQTYGSAWIDDETPPPAHARFSWRKLLGLTAAFFIIGVAVLWLVRGEQTLLDMGEFFTTAAFLTIGGAYAVLPYVYQGAVEHYAWLTGPQMMDGLALGEATPGPLIMVVTWVGYLGGGLLGAAVATFFTFLPSFWFILAGGPIVESTRENLRLAAPLLAITAAVVGVIVNLAVFFAWHAFWPEGSSTQPFAGGVDGLAVVIAILSAVALWRGIDVLRV